MIISTLARELLPVVKFTCLWSQEDTRCNTLQWSVGGALCLGAWELDTRGLFPHPECSDEPGLRMNCWNQPVHPVGSNLWTQAGSQALPLASWYTVGAQDGALSSLPVKTGIGSEHTFPFGMTCHTRLGI